ncbi:hypothetical protein HYD_1570 [Candidatus Hydrogenosomobacter endosymbioticus]|uniref:LmbE family protein n=2 Tax=Candidatus Hydrogenosomobacter endosymbioticus TaxID=2558174 RepID=A0ABN6L2S3_9PROT|nr:hypothetical protein HYD_1570 [Candidatus Hydrogenosomobacter endosymbioticus]
MKTNRIIFLSPHTDDSELGSGGTISKMVENGADVWVVAFSKCEKSIKNSGLTDSKTLVSEFHNSMDVLGVAENRRITLDFEVREFQRDRQLLLDNMIKISKEISPDTVVFPSKSDIHQDHSSVYLEAMRTFKNCSMWCYEMIWNNFGFDPNMFISLNSSQIEKKIAALSCYDSQKHTLKKGYFNDSFIRGLAVARGIQCGCDFAESFEAIRIIW